MLPSPGISRFIRLLIALAAFGLCSHPVFAGLVNRWSFNNAAGAAPAGTTLADSVSGAVATVWGINSTFTGTALRLTGTTTGNTAAATISGYVELPNGIISSKTNLTVEVWATPISLKTWMRVFDFGRTNLAGVGTGTAAGEVSGVSGTAAPGGTAQASDNLLLSFVNNGTLSGQRMEMMLNGGSKITRDTTLTTVLGTEYQWVVTFEDGVGVYGSTGGQVSWYRNGVIAATHPVAFKLANIEDVNNWLGRSQWSPDSNANADYNEVRIYNHAMTPAEVLSSFNNGPTVYTAYVPPVVGPVAPAQPTNRWSFNNAAAAAASGATFTDSIGSAVATLRGIGGTLSGSSIVLPGTTTGNATAAAISAYVDLPNGIVSSKANFSMECWATPLSSKNQQRLFDIGRSTVTYGTGAATGEILDGAAAQTFNGYDNLVLSLNGGTVLGTNRIEGQYANGAALLSDTPIGAVTSAGTQYHFVLTVEDGAGYYGAAGCLGKWYRDGQLVSVLSMNFHLTQLADVNNWLGRSQYSADNNSNVAINEFRLYNKTLSPAEINLSLALGTDTSIGAAVTQPDSVTIHAGQKVLISVLANDTGSINPSTVEIVTPPSIGTATPDGAGRILYAHAGISTTPVTFTCRAYGAGGYTAPQTVTVQIANVLRIANSTLNVPATPPATAIQIVPAFPGVTFLRPLCFATPPGDTKRLFVCELGGLLKVIPDVTATTPASSVVLDLPTLLASRTGESIVAGGDNECGLLGLAFHPNYATNGYFYITYSVRKSTDTAVWYQRLSRFTVPAAQRTQPAPVADSTSELILIEQRDRDDNHNGGDLHFGADGYLYYSIGDEANPNDTRKNSQRIDMNFFGGMLRLDVDKKPGNLEPSAHVNPAGAALGYSAVDAIPRDAGIARYSIPIDNPYVTVAQGGTWDGMFDGVATTAANLPYIRSEFYAVGLRSPWRFSIDGPTGEIWVGDVGQDTYEEVDLITKAANGGWAFREGLHNGPKSAAAPADFDTNASYHYTPPIWEYTHTGIAGGDSNYKGNSVIGGVVYRGTRFASLTGAYFFGDQVSGNVWSLTRPGGVTTVQRIAGVAALDLTTFGTDPSNGDVLLSAFFTGSISRLITTTPSSTYPTTLSATGLFADLTDLSPSPSVLPYSPNLTFWSDYAVKRRWFTIPDGTSRMTWSRDGLWNFPVGQIWVKHFDLETTRGNPAVKKRIETRILVRNATGIYGVSYRWNDAGTEATLVADGGDDFGVPITVAGSAYTQAWRIPSRSQCAGCHSAQAGLALSFNTRQLNLSNTINGFIGNQIDLLRTGGYFSNTSEPSNVLPRHLRPDETSFPLEARARSYFAVNCSYCHQSGGSGPSWDGRPELALTQTGLVNGTAATALSASDKLIVPGDTAHSVILSRMSATNGYTRMPPLATNETDPTDITLITNWITSSLPSRQSYADWRLATFGSSTSPASDPAADADADGRTNYAEFLAGTNPQNGGNFLTPQLLTLGNTVTVTFTVPTNRSAQIETSTDLSAWSLWDVIGNSGIPQAGGTVNLTGPTLGAKQFFRLKLQEN